MFFKNFNYKFILFILGKLIWFKLLKNETTSVSDISIFSLLNASFVALFLNFFLPLNIYTNSLFLISIFSLLFPIEIICKRILFLSIVSLLCFFNTFDNEYRPDSGLYHLPYTQIINKNSIIIGLANLHLDLVIPQ